MTLSNKQRSVRLLKQCRSQIEGIIDMYDEERPATEISVQILSCIALMKRVNIDSMKLYFENCIRNARKRGQGVKQAEDIIEEAVKAIGAILK